MHSLAVIEAINASPLNRGLDGAAWVATPGNIAIEIGANITLFDWCGDDTFEVHFLFEQRGRLGIIAAREAFRRMFLDHGAKLIYGLTPVGMRHALIFARWTGGRSAGIRQTADGPCELFVLPRENWKDEPK